MSRNGSGTYNLPQPAFVSGTVISSTAVNSDFNDIANALTASIANDGQTPILANLPMSTYRHTGVGNAVARSDYAAAGQVQDGAFIWCGTAGGTADALTLTPSPAITAYAAGQVFRFIAGASPNTGAATVTVSGLGAKAIQSAGAALSAGAIVAGREYQILYDGTQFQLSAWAAGASVTVASNAEVSAATNDTKFISPLKLAAYAWLPADGRLTLTTATPVTTTDVTAASTLYYTPYVGNRIAIYNGTSWSPYTFTERSLALSGLTSGRPYDVFLYDNSGTLTLELTAWTNDTTRATALTYQDGVLVRSGATTRRYLGTIYTTGTTTTEDSVSKRFVWNAYNRILRKLRRVETTSTWTYTTATWRQANAAAANQVEAVFGLAEDVAAVKVHMSAFNSGSIIASVGIGVDSTSTNSADICGGFATTNGNEFTAFLDYIPTVGRHYFAWLEWSTASGTTTWSATQSVQSSGITGVVRA
jgi:hypothetical protein